MSNKKTAIDFFLKEMSDIIGIVNTDAFQNLLMVDAYNKAKQMEKEQITKAYNSAIPFKFGKEYYNETYDN